MTIFSTVVGYLTGKYKGGSKDIAIHQIKEGSKPSTSMSCFAPGFEVNPANGENLVIQKIKGSNSFVVSIGGTNQNIAPDTQRGERRLYSVDDAGQTLKAEIKLKNNGAIEIKNASGSYVLDDSGVHTINAGSDFGVAYTYLDTALKNQDTALNGEFTKIEATLAAVLTALNSLGVPVTPPYTKSNISTDISGAKVNELKLP